MIEGNNEIKLLLSCSKPKMNDKSADNISRLLQEEMDWNWILDAARFHRIIPVVYRNLKMVSPDAVPKEVLAELRRVYLFNVVRSMILTRELLSIINKCQVNGIEAVPFKGPALAHVAYGDITLRSHSDLDILVKKQDVLKAKDLLISTGYHPEIKFTPLQEKIWLKSECEYNFARNDPLIRVEIHWRFLSKHYSVPFDERIWSRIVTMRVKGTTINCLSPDDLLLALCAHASKHKWSQIKLVRDIACVMEVSPINWKQVYMVAVDTGLKRILHIGLLLAHNLLGATIPEQIQGNLEKDPKAKNRALDLSKKLFDDFNRQDGTFKNLIFWLKARERLSDKARHIINLFLLCFKPNPVDYDLVSFPDRMYFLYCIIRPARLFWKYGLKRKQL